MRERWRLLLHAPSDGAWNMAVDEALLESCLGSPEAAPTLRLYGFAPPALSLGKSQPAADVRDVRMLERLGLGLVRRPTGGRAVLHEHERTYAVIGRLDRPPFAGGVLGTYRVIAQALELGLREAGVDARVSSPAPIARAAHAPRRAAACFGALSTHELSVGGRKLVGSAQLRRGGAFLQHGSIPWRLDATRLARLLGEAVDAQRLADLERAAPGLTPEKLDAALVSGFARSFGVELVPGSLTESEALAATRLRAWKHLSAAWTLEARSSSAR